MPVALFIAVIVKVPPLLLVRDAPDASVILLATAVCPLLMTTILPEGIATGVAAVGTVPALQFVAVFQSVLVPPLKVFVEARVTKVILLEAALATLVDSGPLFAVTVKV